MRWACGPFYLDLVLLPKSVAPRDPMLLGARIRNSQQNGTRAAGLDDNDDFSYADVTPM